MKSKLIIILFIVLTSCYTKKNNSKTKLEIKKRLLSVENYDSSSLIKLISKNDSNDIIFLQFEDDELKLVGKMNSESQRVGKSLSLNKDGGIDAQKEFINVDGGEYLNNLVTYNKYGEVDYKSTDNLYIKCLDYNKDSLTIEFDFIFNEDDKNYYYLLLIIGEYDNEFNLVGKSDTLNLLSNKKGVFTILNKGYKKANLAGTIIRKTLVDSVIINGEFMHEYSDRYVYFKL